MRVEDIILAPVVTEKAVRSQEEGIYSFYVHEDATKIDVQIAMSSLWGRSDVMSVKIVKLPKKVRLIGRGKIMTKRQAQRKAYVRFSESKIFEFAGVESVKS